MLLRLARHGVPRGRCGDADARGLPWPAAGGHIHACPIFPAAAAAPSSLPSLLPPLRSLAPQVRLQEALGHWRTKIASNGREWEERNRALRHEKEIMGRHYAKLKVRSCLNGGNSTQ